MTYTTGRLSMRQERFDEIIEQQVAVFREKAIKRLLNKLERDRTAAKIAYDKRRKKDELYYADRQIITPHGTFANLKAAAEFYSMSEHQIRYRIAVNNETFYFAADKDKVRVNKQQPSIYRQV
jgi:hypothetical protein